LARALFKKFDIEWLLSNREQVEIFGNMAVRKWPRSPFELSLSLARDFFKENQSGDRRLKRPRSKNLGDRLQCFERSVGRWSFNVWFSIPPHLRNPDDSAAAAPELPPPGPSGPPSFDFLTHSSTRVAPIYRSHSVPERLDQSTDDDIRELFAQNRDAGDMSVYEGR
jgi:hypothetical protein